MKMRTLTRSALGCLSAVSIAVAAWGAGMPTDPRKGFVVVFRFYGPTEGYIEKSWVLGDFERVN